jgi:hypothetical protein
MDDLIDRLAVVSPAPARPLDLAFVRTRGRRRQRRRTAGMGVAGVAVVLLAGLGASRLLGSDDPARQVTTTAPPEVVPAEWGGPIAVLAGDDQLYVQLDEMVGEGGGGIARLDPASGALTPLFALGRVADVAYGDGSFWTVDPEGRRLDRLDPATGERQHRFELPDLAGSTPGDGWRVEVGESGVWVVSQDGAGLHWFAIDGSQANGHQGTGGEVLAGPVVDAAGVWLGQPDGLKRITTANGARPYGGPQTGQRITALAPGSDRLWVAFSAGAGAAASIGYLPLGAEPTDPLLGVVELDGGVETIGVTEDHVCVAVGGVNTVASVRCGAIPPLESGGAPNFDRVTDITSTGLTSFDGVLWDADWTSGQVIRLDPSTGATEAVVDLPFDGEALVQQQMTDLHAATEPIGPIRDVVTDEPMPNGVGTWSYRAWEATAGLCGQFVVRGREREPDCAVLPFGGALSVGYSDGRFGPFLARAFTSPEVVTVRFELRDFGDLETPTVATFSDVRVAAAVLPDDAVLERTVAYDAGGNVVDTAMGSFGVPED